MDLWGAQLYGEPCRECGFSWSHDLDETIGLVEALPVAVAGLVAHATGDERLAGLDWNVTAYIAHVTDNLRIWAERVIGVARGVMSTLRPTTSTFSPTRDATTPLTCGRRRGRWTMP